jgi:XRE family transcriptional regulator, regulator of sulfur utilization
MVGMAQQNRRDGRPPFERKRDRTMSIGEKIRELRGSAGMSLADLERDSGLSKGYLSQLERGESDNPSVDALLKIAGALRVEATYLMGTKTENESEPPKLPEGLKTFLEERDSKGDAIPAEDVRMLLGIKYRGRQPQTPDDWGYLYETIVRIMK